MTEVLHPFPGIHRSHTAPAASISGNSESQYDKRVLDWQFNVAKSSAGSKAPSNVGSKAPSNAGSKAASNAGCETPTKVGSKAPSNAGSETSTKVGSKAPSNVGSIRSIALSKKEDPPSSLPRSNSYPQRSEVAKSTTSSAQEQFKQVASLHASRKHEDYEYDYAGHITPPLGLSRIIRRETTTTTTTTACFDSTCVGCSHCAERSQINVSINNAQQPKTNEDDSGISSRTVLSALLGVAAGAAVAYAVFNKFADKKEEREREEPIRMASQSPSASGSKAGSETPRTLDIIDENGEADHEMFRPEVRLAIMPPLPIDENVWAGDKQSMVSKHSARRSMNGETTLVGGEEHPSVVGSETKRSLKHGCDKDGRAHRVMDREAVVVSDLIDDYGKSRVAAPSIARSRAPESYVSARSHGSARHGSRSKHVVEIPEDESSDASSDSESESEQEIRAQRSSRVSAREVPLPESVVSHRSRRSHASTREVPKAESVASHRSRRSHYSTRDNREERHSSGSRRSHVSARDIPLPASEVSSSRRSRVSARDQDAEADHHPDLTRSRYHRRSGRSNASRRSEYGDDNSPCHHSRDPHEVLRGTEHSTDAIIGANFAAEIAAIASNRRSSKHSNISAHNIPLPSGDTLSCVTAREIPLPESELGGAVVKGGVYGGGGLGLGLGNRLSARFVPLPESEVGSMVMPEDSISNVGARRRRR